MVEKVAICRKASASACVTAGSLFVAVGNCGRMKLDSQVKQSMPEGGIE